MELELVKRHGEDDDEQFFGVTFVCRWWTYTRVVTTYTWIVNATLSVVRETTYSSS